MIYFKYFYIFDFIWTCTFVIMLISTILNPKTGFALVGQSWTLIASIVGIIIGVVLFVAIRYIKKIKEEMEE